MPPSTRPPETHSRVTAFNPLVLDRTVIAVPLLKQMRDDLDMIAEAKKADLAAAQQYNSAIRFNRAYPGGIKKAFAWTKSQLTETAQEALASYQTRAAAAQHVQREQQRYDALSAAIDRQKLAPLQPRRDYSFAHLHAAVIRRLLTKSHRAAVEAGPDRKLEEPILHVYPQRFEIIIDLNLEYPGGRQLARQWVIDNIERAKVEAEVDDAGQEIHFEKDQRDSQYLFARLEARAIQKLVEIDMAEAKRRAENRTDELEKKRAKTAAESGDEKTPKPPAKPQLDPAKHRAIYHIWPDFEISACISKSIATVKADAAQNSFSARGAGITWAVMDSGIERSHPHFATHNNIDPTSTWHKDFTVDGGGPFQDANGHGTHVAGIIAGEWRVPPNAPEGTKRPIAISRYLKKDTEDVEFQETRLDSVSGMAPQCKLVSLRVLDENGKGSVSNLIAAINHVQEINGFGRRLLIHGVNMSVGYNFEPEWFACGQSPLCVEVDRLVKSGVVVVVAAGNTGYGTIKADAGATSAGIGLTINDPGNADLAITVGSTHRDMPHIYGVSYFSSKGPTGDGRLKPDLLAPGEKIISCATGTLKSEGAKGKADICDYVETSGTSMAAPHVSGVIAAFLSVRGEFIGKAERVKEIFLSTATDLRRDRYFQGAGLVDLMRAIQSV
ncbi:hypothetical protein BH20VER1_BH20VER1_29730 [soil metagenome]